MIRLDDDFQRSPFLAGKLIDIDLNCWIISVRVTCYFLTNIGFLNLRFHPVFTFDGVTLDEKFKTKSCGSNRIIPAP